MNAEHAAKLVRAFCNLFLRDPVNEDPALFPFDGSVNGIQRLLDAADQKAVEKRTVQSLEMDLRISNKNNLFHVYLL